MKATDRSILLGLVVLGLLAAFWFLLLSPKRERAAELETRVGGLQDEVAQQEQLAAVAEQARGDYAQNFERLVLLGKAAPAGGDTPSLLAQLSSVASRAGTEFGSLAIDSSAATAPPPAPAAQTTTDQNAAEGVPTSETPAEPVASGPATEASAAQLPLGSTVGPAGLGVLPYSLQFTGDFFQIADLLAGLDAQVGSKARGAEVDGRLVTVNGFSMAPGEAGGDLSVDLSITTYVLPGSQGLTAGATPAAPPPSIPPAGTVTTSTPPTP